MFLTLSMIPVPRALYCIEMSGQFFCMSGWLIDQPPTRKEKRKTHADQTSNFAILGPDSAEVQLDLF